MSDKYIIDTNVWVKGSIAGDNFDLCNEACFRFLQLIKDSTALVVMDLASFGDHKEVPGNSVLQELKRNLSEGDFAHDLIWRDLFYQNRFHCISLVYDEEGAVIPGDIVINQVEPDGTVHPFEPNDRKWIALHLIDPDRPPIYVAADGDWEKARADLTKHGVKVVQLCTGANIP